MQVRALHLFATILRTHALGLELDSCANVHLDATEHGTRWCSCTPCAKAGDRSFGLAVAQLAGVPRESSRRRAPTWRSLRAPCDGGAQHAPHAGANGRDSWRSTRAPRSRRLCRRPGGERRLEEIQSDELSPARALELLYELKRLPKS